MPLPLVIAGTALQLVGNYAANMRQAEAELQNADIYAEQAEFQQFAKQREIGLIARDYAQTYGQQTSAYARGGVDVSGSAGMNLGMTIARYAEEALATQRKYDLESKITRARGLQARQTGEMLASPGYNAVQGGTTILNNINAYNRGTGGDGLDGTSYAGSGPMSPRADSSNSLPTLTMPNSYLGAK